MQKDQKSFLKLFLQTPAPAKPILAAAPASGFVGPAGRPLEMYVVDVPAMSSPGFASFFSLLRKLMSE